MSTVKYKKKPEWLKISLAENSTYREVKNQLAANRLVTVCEEARCPNKHECWSEYKTATFMVLGNTCTRRCRFCSVKTGLPGAVDWFEPQRISEAVNDLNLKHVVITMVNRDDLEDGGAGLLSAVIDVVRKENSCTIEILSSDLMGNKDAISLVLDAKPEIMSHNIETVRSLTPLVRSNSNYVRSLQFLQYSAIHGNSLVKSSIMVGLGETMGQVEQTMVDLKKHGVQILNIGQYLQPTRTNLPVQKYYKPGEFEILKKMALEKGFLHCESGPLVRSSYHAGRQYNDLIKSLSDTKK